MSHRLLSSAVLLCAALATGCAGFEQSVTSSTSPSGVPTPVPSLLGTWTSSALTTTGSSCTNFQWRVTGQQGNAISGDFSVECAGGVSASGSASGQLNGDQVPYQIVGTAVMPGGTSCPVTISGTARIEGDAIRIPYSGTTCLGPIHGEEVLRRPPSPPPPPPPDPPPPPPPPPPTENPFHVGPGPLSLERAEAVVRATSREFSSLLAPRPTEGESVAATTELLRRMIWHLQLAGFQAGRQRNPSGAISGDKMTIAINGVWRAFDVFRSVGTPGVPVDVIFLEVSPANYVADGGIPD